MLQGQKVPATVAMATGKPTSMRLLVAGVVIKTANAPFSVAAGSAFSRCCAGAIFSVQ